MLAVRVQDLPEALNLWSQAAMRLQSAASLDVGDTSPLNALGDVHSGRAERLLNSQPAEVRQCPALPVGLVCFTSVDSAKAMHCCLTAQQLSP